MDGIDKTIAGHLPTIRAIHPETARARRYRKSGIFRGFAGRTRVNAVPSVTIRQRGKTPFDKWCGTSIRYILLLVRGSELSVEEKINNPPRPNEKTPLPTALTEAAR